MPKSKGFKHKTADSQHASSPRTGENLQPKAFFKKFSTNGFVPKQNAEFAAEFDRLADHMGWVKFGKAYERHRSEAVKQQMINPPTQAHKPQSSWIHENSKLASPALTEQPSSSFWDELDQLARQKGWSKKSKDFREHKVLATEQEIRSIYGECSQLQGWQQLCDDIGITPIPSSIKKCKVELAKVYVNIYDLLDWRRQPTPRQPFGRHESTLKALRAYSMKSNKIFPKEAAKEEGFIKSLLRPLCHR